MPEPVDPEPGPPDPLDDELVLQSLVSTLVAVWSGCIGIPAGKVTPQSAPAPPLDTIIVRRVSQTFAGT